MYTLSLLLAATLTGQAPAAPSAPDPAQLAELDALARQNHVPAGAKQSMAAARALYAAHPDSYDAAWRLARAAFLRSYGQSDDGVRSRLGWEGYEAGKRATELRPDGVEGHYWAGCALGEYGQSAGIVKAVYNGVGGKVQALFERAAALDPRYNEAGPLEALGRYYHVLPWPMQDLKKAQQLLERAVQLAPHKVRCNAYLADVYLELDQPELARKYYGVCAAAATRPEIEIDAARWQAHCRQQLKELPPTP